MSLKAGDRVDVLGSTSSQVAGMSGIVVKDDPLHERNVYLRLDDVGTTITIDRCHLRLAATNGMTTPSGSTPEQRLRTKLADEIEAGVEPGGFLRSSLENDHAEQMHERIVEFVRGEP